jgi:hypothetical protein
MLLAGFLALQLYLKPAEDSPAAGFGWLLNLGLMLTIWWCANKLTWDCTYIDEKVDASGKGLLEAAGLDQEAPSTPDDEDATPKEPVHTTGIIGWWDRYQRYREERSRNPHTPGVWVVYFSLAALPIFGLGQALVPAADAERRRYIFWLMVCYVASGLSLLVTTSYLGLRRYLRQRKLRMPAAMTAMWLALGGGMIVVFMVLGALLPRPYGEYQLIRITPFGSKDREASQYALKRGEAGKGQGSSSSAKPRKDQEAQSGSGTKSGDEGQGKSQTKGGSGRSGKSRSGSGKSSGKSGNGQSKSKQNDDSKNDNEQKDNQDRDADKDSDKDKENRDAENQQDRDQQNKSSSSRGSGRDEPKKSASRQTSSGSDTPPSNPVAKVLSGLGKLGTVLKWILFAAIALIVGFFLVRAGLRFLANFTSWAQHLLDALRAWWEALFGRGKREKSEAEETEEAEERAVRPRPFASFQNPFHDGRSEQMTPNDLVRYSFEALQAWAYERDLAREPRRPHSNSPPVSSKRFRHSNPTPNAWRPFTPASPMPAPVLDPAASAPSNNSGTAFRQLPSARYRSESSAKTPLKCATLNVI